MINVRVHNGGRRRPDARPPAASCATLLFAAHSITSPASSRQRLPVAGTASAGQTVVKTSPLMFFVLRSVFVHHPRWYEINKTKVQEIITPSFNFKTCSDSANETHVKLEIIIMCMNCCSKLQESMHAGIVSLWSWCVPFLLRTEHLPLKRRSKLVARV